MKTRKVLWNAPVVLLGAAVVGAAILGGASLTRGQSDGQPAVRAEGKQADSAKRPIKPGEINLKASRVYIFVDKKGFGHQHGVVGRLERGELKPAASPAGRLVFDMKSFTVDTEAARRYVGLEGEVKESTQQQVTATMLGAEVLDVEQYPTATFEVSAIKPLEAKSEAGKPQYQLDGRFTLHGATRPLQFAAEGTIEKGYLHLKGNFPLLQSAFKIRPFKKALGAVGVADELTVYGDIWVKR